MAVIIALSPLAEWETMIRLRQTQETSKRHVRHRLRRYPRQSRMLDDLGLHSYVSISSTYVREGIMTRSSVFKSNRSQAVRLPKPVAFPEDVHQVEVVKLGNSRLISPVGHRWDDLFATGPRASPDFMLTREQPLEEECEPL
jgi:antitoxin VapB